MNNAILPKLQLFLKMSPFLCGDENTLFLNFGEVYWWKVEYKREWEGNQKESFWRKYCVSSQIYVRTL